MAKNKVNNKISNIKVDNQKLRNTKKPTKGLPNESTISKVLQPYGFF